MAAVATINRKAVTREVLLGFWKVHILHHAAEQPVVGQWVLAELRRHGYDVSPGTLYPLLKRMERNGWLRCRPEPGGGLRGRRYYHLTADGAAVLAILREAVEELHHELGEHEHDHSHAPASTSRRKKTTPARASATTRRAAGRRS